MPETDVPDAELLIAPGCPHCPAVLAALADLLKQGRIGRLQVINLGAHPAAAGERGARGAPWIRIGPFELTGSHTPTELAQWAKQAGSAAGRHAYLLKQLEAGELDSVIAVCRRDPTMRLPLIDLAADLETPFAARIGVGAVFEDLGPDGLLADLVDALDRGLARSGHAQVRADAAHVLGLTGTEDARPALQRLAADPDAEVREIAAESLEAIGEPFH